jgi:hypothetical protein
MSFELKAFSLKKQNIIFYGISLCIFTIIIILRLLKGTVFVDELTYKALSNIIPTVTIPATILILLIQYIIFIGFIYALTKIFPKKMLIPKIMITLSPPILYGIFNITQTTIMGILAIFIWISIERKIKILPYILSISIGLMSFPIGMGFACFLFSSNSYSSNKNRLTQNVLVIIAAAIIGALFLKDTLIKPFSSIAFNALIQEFGTYQGISFVFVMLAILGISAVRQRRSFTAGNIAALAIGIFAQEPSIIVISILIFASLLLHKIATMSWTAQALKIGVYVFLLLTIINSTLIFTQGHINASPSHSDTALYEKLEAVHIQNGIIPIESAYYFEFTTKNTAFAKIDTPLQQKVLNQIFYSTDLNYTVSLLQENNISHILINENMLTDIWSNQRKGLLVMITNEEFFTPTYLGSSNTVFEVVQ